MIGRNEPAATFAELTSWGVGVQNKRSTLFPNRGWEARRCKISRPTSGDAPKSPHRKCASETMVAQSMKEVALTDQDSDWRMRVTDYVALEHNVTIASAAVFLLGFGEELWKEFRRFKNSTSGTETVGFQPTDVRLAQQRSVNRTLN